MIVKNKNYDYVMIACTKRDSKAIHKIKKYLGYRNASGVVHAMILDYLNSGKFDEITKRSILGEKLYDMYCK